METEDRSTLRNPKLEALRHSVLNTKNANVEDMVKLLSEDLASIHASFLFIEKNGLNIVRNMCLLLTATSNDVINRGWMDLGEELGLTYNQLMCIKYGNYTIFEHSSDYTETVLITFAQRQDATLDNILTALVTIERLDVVFKIIKDLEELAKEVKLKDKQIKRIEEYNTECNVSNNQEDLRGTTGIGIIRPLGYKLVQQKLPITLTEKLKPEKFVHENSKPFRTIQVESVQRSIPSENSQNNKTFRYSILVMLTFAFDGEEIAQTIAKILRQTFIKNLPVGVLMLQNHKTDVLSNPEQFISHIFPQMDYVFPILTDGYFKALTDGNPLTDCIDERYVPFIHDLMAKYYVQNHCKNKKVRSIIADVFVQDIQKNLKYQNDPVLQAWVKESDIEDLTKSLCSDVSRSYKQQAEVTVI